MVGIYWARVRPLSRVAVACLMLLTAVSGMKLSNLYLSKLVFLVWTGMEAGRQGWAPTAGNPAESIKELTWGWELYP